MELEAIPQRIKAVRNALGLTQGEMARAIGTTLRSWQEYEAGRRRPGLLPLLGLAGIGVNINWLLTGKGPMHLKDPENPLDIDLLQAIIETLENLPEAKDLAPERKARLMAAVYDLYARSEQPLDRERIARLIRSAL